MNAESRDDYDISDTDDRYNNDLNINNFYTQFNRANCPSSEYIYIDNNSLPYNNVISVLTVNIRSIPKNFQSFVDTILCNLSTKCNILGLTEIRLSPHLSSLYQLSGYKVFTNPRNTHGGGVALYVSSSINCIPLTEFSKVDDFIESIGVQTTIMKKKIVIAIYL